MWLILKEDNTLLSYNSTSEECLKSPWLDQLVWKLRRVRMQWGIKLSDSPLFSFFQRQQALQFGGTLYRTLRHLMLLLFESIKP